MFLISSCAKDAGEGGTSTIVGKVKVRNYNATFTLLLNTYYGSDEDVYIIYGEDSTKAFGDRTRTAPGGNYEFKYLRPGTYWLYAYSEDSTLTSPNPIAKFTKVVIEAKKQEVEADDITVLR